MANRIHSYGSCPLWNVSVGVRICCQICSSRSGSGAMRLQSFADFQGSGWKLANFLQWPSNVVTALANGARQGVSQAGSLSAFSLPYLTLSLPWLMVLCRGWVRPDRGLQQKPGLPARSHLWWLLAPGKVAGVSGASKTSNVVPDSRFEHLARQASNLRKYTSCHSGSSYTVHDFYIIIRFYYSIRFSSMSTRILAKHACFEHPPVYNFVYCIRFSAYTILRSTLYPSPQKLGF
jgi:hypothetical protein